MRFSAPLSTAATALALATMVAPFAPPAGAATAPTPRAAVSSSDSQARIVDQAVRDGADCAVFSGQRYCVGLGFTTMSESEAESTLRTMRATASARTAPGESTGDLDTSAAAGRYTESQRRAELTMAAAGAQKAAELSPEALDSSTSNARIAYPGYKIIMDPRRVAEQVKYWYCGPTSMQMIAWGWSGVHRTQVYWADRLGTTSSGTSITDMVRVTNEATGWDNADHAGTYIVLNIGGYTFRQWFTLMQKHISQYRAPVILHPILLKRYFAYLDDDASGHFQVGRGYDTSGPYRRINYFEPWNQQRFDPTEPFIRRKQWHRATLSFAANLAHPAHNMGV